VIGRWLSLSLSLALALLAAAPAQAAPPWIAPADLSAPGHSSASPDVAIDPQGNAVAVWSSRLPGAERRVQAALRPQGGGWQAPVDLSAAGQDAGAPHVAVDAQGNAVVAWVRSNGAEQVVQSAARPAGGAWQAAVDISAAGGDARAVQLGTDAHGTAVAVWLRGSAGTAAVQGAVRPAGAAWHAAADLSAPGQSAGDPQVGVGGQGTAVVVWPGNVATPAPGLFAAVRAAGGAWQAPVTLAAGARYPSSPRVAVDALGNAVAVWQRLVGTTWVGGDDGRGDHIPDHRVQAALLPAGGAWQAATDLSATGSGSLDPQVAAGARGDAVVVWSRSAVFNALSVVESAVRPAGAGWQPPDVLSGGRGAHALRPQAAVDVAGRAVAVWTYGSLRTGVEGAVRLPGRGWQAPSNLAPSGRVAAWPSLAVDARGHAVAVWRRGSPTDPLDGRIQASDANIAPAAPPGPAVRALRLSPATFRAAGSGPSVNPGARRASTIVRYRVNAAAVVRFEVQRVAAGRRAGAGCVAPKRANRGRSRCERFITLPGGFTRRRTPGADRLTFTGRVRGRALKAGHYRLVATPSVDERRGVAARARFRIRAG